METKVARHLSHVLASNIARRIIRLIKHIPEKHFRMIHYFGFLANRVVGQKLPQIRKALWQEETPPVKKVTFAVLSQTLLHTDPFSCILCGAKMVYRKALAAVKLNELIANAVEIARMCTYCDEGQICLKSGTSFKIHSTSR